MLGNWPVGSTSIMIDGLGVSDVGGFQPNGANVNVGNGMMMPFLSVGPGSQAHQES